MTVLGHGLCRKIIVFHVHVLPWMLLSGDHRVMHRRVHVAIREELVSRGQAIVRFIEQVNDM